MKALFSNAGTTLLLMAAILVGGLLGWLQPVVGAALGARVDPLLLTLVSLLFFEVNLACLRRWREHGRVLAIAWVCNFLIIPALGWGIARLFLSGQPLFFTGLVIYFMAPCTDWFLGFTRMARGHVALGTVLLPLNLLTQVLLFPVYLHFFAGQQVAPDLSSLGRTLWTWCFQPLFIASAVHLTLRRLLPAAIFGRMLALTGRLIPCVLAALVVCIFAANVSTMLEHVRTFLLILAAVFVFFVLTYYLAEGAAKFFHLAYADHALLTMTTAARNAPLMLGLTMGALPNQPLIYAALIIGMLVEFPHLTALKHLLLRRADAPPAPPASSSPYPAPALPSQATA